MNINDTNKSTLLKILTDTTPIQTNDQQLNANIEIDYFKQHQLKKLTPTATIIQKIKSVTNINTYPIIRKLLKTFLFSKTKINKPISVLSKNKKTHLTLYKLLLQPVDLLLMNEPTNHLDLESCTNLKNTINHYQKTLVIMSHNRYFINTMCDHVLKIEHRTVT